MSVEFRFIGWCKEDNHDKVWTVFKAGDTWYAGWGKRDKALSFKQHNTGPNPSWDLRKLIEQKKSKGYVEVDKFRLFVLFPNFEESVQSRLVFATLANKVK